MKHGNIAVATGLRQYLIMRDNSFSKPLIVFSFLLLGLLLGVMLVAAMDENGRQYLLGAGMLLAAAAVVIAARAYLLKQKRTPETIKDSKEGSEVGFVVDTFHELVTKLKEKEKELEAQVELNQRLSQLGEMSAGISHELRNSMSVISGYAKLLGKKVDESNKPTVDSIVAEINSMDRVISELLAFAKPAVLHTERADLNNIINESVETVIAGNDAVNISINAPEIVFVRADDVLLRQAISNILINSIDALPSGGNIEIELSRFSDKAKLSIRDNGPGIPEEIVPKIFLPFFTTRQDGVGLGLALVQKIIGGHGGSIEVVSKEGEGTAFLITIPSVE